MKWSFFSILIRYVFNLELELSHFILYLRIHSFLTWMIEFIQDSLLCQISEE
jgi:hypothetical protein